MQVTSFMFDSNWREAATHEPPNPKYTFVTGAKVKHPYYGIGEIKSTEEQNSGLVMSISFEKGEQKMTYGLHELTIVEE